MLVCWEVYKATWKMALTFIAMDQMPGSCNRLGFNARSSIQMETGEGSVSHSNSRCHRKELERVSLNVQLRLEQELQEVALRHATDQKVPVI